MAVRPGRVSRPGVIDRAVIRTAPVVSGAAVIAIGVERRRGRDGHDSIRRDRSDAQRAPRP